MCKDGTCANPVLLMAFSMACLFDRMVLILFGRTLRLLAFLHSMVQHLSAGGLIFNSVFVV